MKNEEKIELKKIVLKVKGKELELSLGEARDLKNLLKDLLGDTNGTVYIPTWYTYHYDTQPVPPYPRNSNWIITCGGTTSVQQGTVYLATAN